MTTGTAAAGFSYSAATIRSPLSPWPYTSAMCFSCTMCSSRSFGSRDAPSAAAAADGASREPKERELHMVHEKHIADVYGQGESGDRMVAALYENPAAAVPVVIERLQGKGAEWRKVRFFFPLSFQGKGAEWRKVRLCRAAPCPGTCARTRNHCRARAPRGARCGCSLLPRYRSTGNVWQTTPKQCHDI